MVLTDSGLSIYKKTQTDIQQSIKKRTFEKKTKKIVKKTRIHTVIELKTTYDVPLASKSSTLYPESSDSL